MDHSFIYGMKRTIGNGKYYPYTKPLELPTSKAERWPTNSQGERSGRNDIT